MALIPCPECAHQVSDKAPSCPSCGYPIAGGRGGLTQVAGRVAGTWLSVSAVQNILMAAILFGAVAAVLITLIVVNG
jgi:uncharacterized membrane protein YvbJ